MLNILIFFLMFIPQNDKMVIKDPWIRPSGAGMNSALFFTAVNKAEKPDTLLSAEASFAELVEVHETFTQGDKMGMRKAGKLEVTDSLNFKPGGCHIMFIKLKEDLTIGAKKEVTLVFKNAGEIKITAVVADRVSKEMMKKMKKH